MIFLTCTHREKSVQIGEGISSMCLPNSAMICRLWQDSVEKQAKHRFPLQPIIYEVSPNLFQKFLSSRKIFGIRTMRPLRMKYIRCRSITTICTSSEVFMNSMFAISWKEEAVEVAEIFPSRSLARPRVEISELSKTENIQNCRKNYIPSDYQYSGLFPVQCCCRHHKLLGISVMNFCESKSIVLSFMLSGFNTQHRNCFYDNSVWDADNAFPKR